MKEFIIYIVVTFIAFSVAADGFELHMTGKCTDCTILPLVRPDIPR